MIRLNGWLRRKAWPTFDCADCIGMMIPHGCQCAAYNAIAPCTEAGDWHLFLRWLHGFLFINASPYWTELDDR